MKKVMFVLALLSLGTLCWAGSPREDATNRLDNATTVLHEIMGTPDKGIPEEVLEHARCLAVIPHMVKGGFVFGGKGGKGVATCRTADGWSAPAFITISGGNWGLQIGIEAVDVVMIIQNEKGMQRLLSSNFQVGGDASAAAGPVGRHAEFANALQARPVSFEQIQRRKGHIELLGRNLLERSLEPLPQLRLAREGRDRSIGVDADPGI